MKKLNNKGLVTLAAVFPVVFWIGTFVIAHKTVEEVDFSTASFRERKAVQYCMDEGKDDCHAFVSAMSKTEVLAYIKDTQDRPRF